MSEPGFGVEVAEISLDVTEEFCVLPRVIAVTARRGHIQALTFVRAGPGTSGRIDLRVSTRHEGLLRSRLASLVPVTTVR